MTTPIDNRIALVGIGCRVPGAHDAAGLWRIVREGRDALTDLAEHELLAAGVARAALADPRYVRRAGLLEAIESFDAAFFGLSAEQAELLDPQHRVFYECAWEALEDAGLPPERVRGSVGVFGGCAVSSYLLFNLLPTLRAGASPATLLAMIGNDKDYLASHLSYLLGFKGPSVGVQSACSTSLAAVHLACQSLLARECDLALAGGASVRVPHRVGYVHEEGSILSPTGYCRAFDAAADGTVFGSGAGVVALCRLEDAIERGDRIHAVILGSALNNDGDRKAGYTAPSVDGQAAVIGEALSVADIAPGTLQLVEAHGTGTPIGDPIEVKALAEALAGARTGSIALSAAKASFGHLEAAAGIAGLVSAAMALAHRELPPIAHFREANPLLRLERTPLAVGRSARPWTAAGPRRAGVSSFGIGGTNVHVILEEAPAPVRRTVRNAGPFVLRASARTPASAALAVKHLAGAIGEGADIAAVSRASLLGRRAFEHRVTVVAHDAREAREALEAASVAAAQDNPRLGFVGGAREWLAELREWGVHGDAYPGVAAAEAAGATLLLVLDGAAHASARVPCITATIDPHDARSGLLRAAAHLHAHGVSVDWSRVVGDGPHASLPTYPFERVRYWRDPPAATHAAFPGREADSATARKLIEATLAPGSERWLADHRVEGRVVLPAAAFASLAMATGVAGLRALAIERVLPIDDAGTPVQTLLTHDDRIEVHAKRGGEWLRYAGAERDDAPPALQSVDLDTIRARCLRTIDPATIHRGMAAHGIELGPALQRFAEVRAGHGETLARLVPAGDLAHDGLRVHPAILDALFQALAVAAAERGAAAHLPVSLVALRLAPAASTAQALWCHATLRPEKDGAAGLVGDLALLDGEGHVLLQVEGLVCRPAAAGDGFLRHVYVPRWVPCDAPVVDARPLPHVAAPAEGLADHAAGVEALDRLCAAWVARAFEELGARLVPGQVLALDVPAIPRFERLWPRLWHMLEEDGLIDASRRVLRAPRDDAEALQAAMARSHPSMRLELDMLARCGRELAAVLRGGTDPLALLFGGQGATALYAESPYVRALYGIAAAAIAPLRDTGTPMSVLEVGGGTGGATGAVLEALGASAREYLFTDVSPAFLAAASQRFPVRTGLLDLERPAREQDVPDGSRHLVVASNVLHATTDIARTLRHVRDALVPGGWLLMIEGLRPSRWLDLTFALTEGWWHGTDRTRRPTYPLLDEAGWRGVLAETGFDDVRVYTPGEGRLADQAVIVARRALRTRDEVHVVRGMGDAAAALESFQRLAGAGGRIVTATRGAQAVRPWEAPDAGEAAIAGLARAAALEVAAREVRVVDVDPLANDADRVLALEAMIDDGERDVAWRDGVRYVLRVGRPVREAAPDGAFRLAAREAGNPDSLALQPMARGEPAPGMVEIEVAAAGLNFKDVLAQVGAVASDPDAPLGGEAAGVVVAVGDGVHGLEVGNRVVALGAGAFASHMLVPAARVASIPAGMSFEQAAALPISAMTALHALREVAALRPGERVLVHVASGGVGQHAIALARAAGAEVLATAGSEAKRAWLRAIGVRHVFDSRSAAFAPLVREATNGEGVDVVLNSLTGPAIEAGFATLRTGGRFIEIGRSSIWSAEDVARRFPHVRYHVVALDRIGDAEGGRLLAAVLEAHREGHLAQPPLTRVPMAEAARAYRYMQQARHVGRVVLTLPRPWSPHPDRSHLVTGGLGGLGLALAGWLAAQGATHIVLAGRHAPREDAAARIAALRARGIDVETVVLDVADETAVARLAATFGASRPALQTVFHAAGILEDAKLAAQDASSLARVSAAKVSGAFNLARHCRGIEALVMFGSAAGLLGSAGQANHAAASAALDAVARSLHAQGIDAFTIDWGPWARIGAAAERDVAARLAGTGMGEIAPAEGFAMLRWMLSQRLAHAAMLPIEWSAFRRNAPRIFAAVDRGRTPGTHPAPGGDARLAQDLAALPASQHAAHVEARVTAEAARLMGTNAAIAPDRALTDLGLDSLQAIELRNRLGKLAGVPLPPTLIFDYPSVRALARHLVTLLAEGSSAAAAAPQAPAPRAREIVAVEAKREPPASPTHAPIAVIGIGCRMPGGVRDVDAFWRLLESGTDAVTEVPRDRWDADAWYDPDPDAPGKMNTRRGGFLDAVDRFDAAFFGISPREATSMDPQQRLVLEVAWRALEHAGVPPLSLEGSRTGVYLGLCTSDYTRIGDGVASMTALDTYSGTGGANGVAAGRLSYTLGLSGPSLVVDTACSSSLVAAHLAVQGLRTRECDLALAGGVNLVLLPDGTVTLSRLHMMAPDGRCKAFDESADGFVRGEGCGIVVLKRLDDALAAGDPVLAVIRGSAVNQDGRSAGLTAPSGLAQQAVVRAALADGNVDAASVTYVECHGTGTSLGDPVEVNALAATLGPARSRPLLIGSVKTNLGHLEAAAGIAGLIKAIETVRRGQVAPSLHFRRINPHIRTGECEISVAARAMAWPDGAPRVAGVSAFGFSGTNAHMVLEAPPPQGKPCTPEEGRSEVLPLSARTPAALAQLMEKVRAGEALASFADACYTAGAGRSAFAHRIAVAASNAHEAREKLAQAKPRAAGTPRIAFLFSGQGAQASGMGAALYRDEPAFRAALDRAAAVLDPMLGRPLTDLMFAGGEALDQTGFTQPALAAFELAMVELLRDWGIEAEALLGHSLGEIAAAAVAGCVSFEDALVLAATRGRLMQALPEGGAMAAVMAGRGEVEGLLARDPALALAADNGPAAVTLSGPAASVDAACAALAARGIGARRLAVSHAFHSSLMDPMLDGLEAAAARITWSAPRVALIGNVDGTPLETPDAAYWRRHARAPVAFAAGMRRLAALGCDTFVEVGPNPVLLGIGRRCVEGGEWIAAARQGSGAATPEMLARLFEAGVAIRWERVHAGRGRRIVAFPGHPFQRESYWKPTAARAQASTHPWLETRTDLPDGRVVFGAKLPSPASAWLEGHRVGGVVRAPAAALLEACASAAQRCGFTGSLSSIALHAGLALDAPREIAIEVDAARVTVSSRPAAGGEWTRHLTAEPGGELAAIAPVAAHEAPESIRPDALHAWMAAGGIEHDATFRRLREAMRGDGVALAKLEPLAASPHRLHPALLDAALQAIAVATFGQGDGRMRVPVRIDGFSIEESAELDECWAHVRMRDGEALVADVMLCDGEGRAVARVAGLRLAETAERPPWHDWLLERVWREAPMPLAPAALAREAAAFASHESTRAALAKLEGLGALMDRAAGAYAREALDAVAQAEVAPRHRALYARLPLLARAATGETAAAVLAAARERYPGCEREIGLLERCGRELAAVLKGGLDPLQLIFPADGGDNVYRDSPVSRALNRGVEDAVLAALPADGPLRILEIGAGTGGTTDGLLERLPTGRIAEYAFTDISRTLLAAARRRYAAHSWLETRALDIDADPLAQGFAGSRYHVVVAANVMHAALDLKASLEHAAKLLAPGGVLVLLEGAGAQGWIDLVFGLTEGWWRFADRERRPDYPLPDREGWMRALRDAGFEAAAMDARVGDVLERQAILVARRVPRWIVCGGDDALTRSLANEMGCEAIGADVPLPGGAWDGCVFAGATALRDDAESAGAYLDSQRGVLEPLRSLALACGERGMRLAIVTSGAHDRHAAQSTAWGLGRAVAAELPDVVAKRIDIDPALDPRDAARRVAGELAAGDAEDQVLLSRDARRVARLARLEPAMAQPAALDASAAYLVTGGFGGLGLHAARWLADRGARALVLMGRSAPSARAADAIAALERDGVEVHRVIGDVAREEDVRAALAAAKRRVAGVVHAAGTLDDGVLAQLDWTRMRRVLEAKVAGAWLIDRLAPDLDFLLLYSSAVGFAGSSGQANHVAANAFLDALAERRRREGRAAVSLAWGAWSEIGSATSEALRDRMERAGMDPIAPGHARAVLDWALAGAQPWVGVLPIRTAALARALAGRVPPVMRELVPDLPQIRETAPVAQAAASPQPASGPRMIDIVLEEAAHVLAAPSPAAIDPSRSLFEAGLDSLMAVELRNRLQSRVHRALPSTLLFDHPAPSALAAFLGPSQAPAVERESRRSDEPIAIIGMDCRLPGGASDPERFRELLEHGFDAIGSYPAQRTPDARAPMADGAFLDGVDQFDAAFFRIAPREAASMDPQQRMLLEVAWHALERAGQAPDALAGSATGVFVGVCNYDYPQLVAQAGRLDAWSATGGAPSIVAGRLAYTLGLEGPAMVVDTACSSSLVSVHLACRSLAEGECDMALAGGVNLILAPSSTDALSALQMLAPDGRCKAFDARADGFVRGEGCGVVVLKRLSDARAAGDRILAVVRGSFVNQDGRSPSLTAPSGRAQEGVIRGALARAGVDASEVGYVETHGTGTQLGDPIEMHALKAVFGESRAAPLVIGALKSNVGHLEAAAGIAGLVKATLAVAHGRIPPNLHMRSLNPHIDLGDLRAMFPAEPVEWPGVGERIAGVSSFGFSGTNAHVVLAQAPTEPSIPRDDWIPAFAGMTVVLAVSAATPGAARTLARALADRLEADDAPPLADVAYTLVAGRAQLAWRIAIVANDPREAAAALREATPAESPLQPAVANPTMHEEARELAALFLAGARLDARAWRESGANLVDLPVYPFERERHWVEAAAPQATLPAGEHPLLGARVRVPGTSRHHEVTLSIDRVPWLAGHRVAGVPTLPAAAMLEMFAASVDGRGAAVTLADVEFNALLPLEGPVVLHTQDGEGRLALHAAPQGSDDWQAIASASHAAAVTEVRSTISLAVLQEQVAEPVDAAAMYAAFEASALQYGEAFRTVRTLFRGRGAHEGQALACVQLAQGTSAASMRLHPALLDGAFQAVAAAMPAREGARGYLPAGLARLTLLEPVEADTLWAWIRVKVRDDDVVVVDIDLLTPASELMAEVRALRLAPDRSARGRRAFLHDMAWTPAAKGRELPHAWHLQAVGETGAGALADLSYRLAQRGDKIVPLGEARGVVVAVDRADGCDALLGIAQSLARHERLPRLWIVTFGAASADASGAAAWGFAAALRRERPALAATVLDLPAGTRDAALLVDALECEGDVLRASAAGVDARTVMARDGAGVSAHVSLRRPDSGRLADLALLPMRPRVPGAGEVAIRVAAAGLNFRDVMNVLGTYPGDAGELGGECAGYVSALGSGVRDLAIGQPVMAIAAGCHASDAVAPAVLVMPVPRGWTLEQAGSSPTAFLTAALALREVARIEAGQRMLVHAGAGGLGLAAIALARAAGAEVLATAGSEEKRAMLRDLGVECVSDSRSTAFVRDVRAFTGGRGVDIVLNSLSGDLIAAGFDVLRPGGTFLEVGKAGIWSAAQARAHRADVAYHRIALDERIAADPQHVRAMWQGLVAEFESGALAPLPVTPFAMGDAEDAYRFMQQARHVGRIVLTRRTLRPDAAYLVTGGTGALGFATARWLIERGAGEVVLAARHAPSAELLDALRTMGTPVRFVQADVARAEDVRRLLAAIERPLGGIFHAAGTVDDGVLENLTPARFEGVFAAKVHGAAHLDALTRDMRPDLFVLFASAAGVLGSAGQANYAAANAALDGIAARRRAAGLHALSVDWGAWAGEGIAADRAGAAMAPENALAALDGLLREGATQAVVLAEPLPSAFALHAAPPARASLRDSLAGLSAAEQHAAVAAAVRREVATVLSLPEGSLNAQRPLNEYGLDSLMAVELRNALAALAGRPLPSSLLFDYPAIEPLAGFLAQRLGIDDGEPREAPAQPAADAGLTDDELALALTKELERAGY